MNKKITTNNLKINPENLWLILGGAPTNLADTFKTEDALIAAKVPQSKTAYVTKHIKWESGKVFYPWEPGLDSDLYPYYCVNDNILYLCTGNTPNNRKDESGHYLTSVPPTNTGAFPTTGSDGYTWLPLYLIDYTKEGFVTDSDFPVPDFNTEILGSNFTSIYSSICTNGITQTGKCCLYYKEAVTDKITGFTYEAGDLMHASANSYCYECYDLAQKLNVYYKFKGGVGETGTCDSVYEITTLFDKLNSMSSSLPPNSTKQFQLNLLKDYQNYYNGILRAEIDLSNISSQNKTVKTENPYLIIRDPHSDGNARVRLITSKLADNLHEVTGIIVEQSGKDYIYPSFTINGETNTELVNAITLHPYPMDVFEMPETLLKNKAFLINTSVSVGDIKDISYNNMFTKIALTTDLKNRADETLSQYAPESNTVVNLQTTFTAVVLNEDGSVPESIFGFGGEQETMPIDCSIDPTANCYTANNVTLNGYDLFVSAIRTGPDLVVGENYGYIPAVGGGTIPGFQLETNDISDNMVSPISVGDKLTILGNNCQVLTATKPILNKNNEYFSPEKIDLDIENLGNNINLNFNIKVTTY